MTVIQKKPNKEKELAFNRIRKDLRFYAENFLKIKNKEGMMVPLILNDPQMYIDKMLNDQLKKTGKVRAMILKARQEGASTYVGARFYHQAANNVGRSVFILSHEGETTKKLFAMVERFYQYMVKKFKPTLRASNAKELKFRDLQSEYFVGTAGNKNVGRGGTIQLFHGSEVAFWDNPDEIRTGLMQSIPNAPGTEIILESTANGPMGMFFEMCNAAMKEDSEYQLIFLPWFWMEEYRLDPPKGFQMSDDERKEAELYDLDDAQIYWRRMKIKDEYSGKEWMFRQEYPANPIEAFQTSGDALFSGERIMEARKNNIENVSLEAPFVLGVDKARTNDRIAFVLRQGRKVHWYRCIDPKTLGRDKEMHLAGMIADCIEAWKLKKVFIDAGDGWGCIDRLCEMGYARIVTGVLFGDGAMESDLYINKRAEMACNARDWLELGGIDIPDSDEFHGDLMSVPEEIKTSSGRKKLVAKDEIKKKFGKSPDIFDAFILTFAYPVTSGASNGNLKRKGSGKHALKTLNRVKRR